MEDKAIGTPFPAERRRRCPAPIQYYGRSSPSRFTSSGVAEVVDTRREVLGLFID
jgi:hypothetical protein